MNYSRGRTIAEFAAAACLVIGLISTGSAAEKSSADAPKRADAQEPYPTEVALLQEARGWTYRQSPSRLGLYVSDKDAANKSTCGEGCATKWLPLIAPDDAKAIGKWTIVKRADGRRQWAYRSQPLYTRIHDEPEAPTGDGVDGVWHLLPYFR